MNHHLRILEEEPEKGYLIYDMVYLGETDEGEIIVDCSRKPDDPTLPGRLYRKNGYVGGRYVHRTERASGKRKDAMKTEHRFLGEPGT